MNSLYMIFDLKGYIVEKEYFSINQLLPLLYIISWLLILLNKRVIPRSSLKEFLLRCLKQFIVYIWTSALIGKMKTYLRKIIEVTCINIDIERIIS